MGSLRVEVVLKRTGKGRADDILSSHPAVFFCMITTCCSLWGLYLFHSERYMYTAISQLKVEIEFLRGKPGAFVLGITFESSPLP